MKKIITLLVSVTMVAIAVAQPGRDYGNGGYGNGGYDRGKDITVNVDWGKKDRDNDVYFFSAKDRDMEIAMINRDIDHKIQSVKMKFFMSRFKKAQAISQLEDERSFKIDQVNKKFFSRKNLYNGGPRKHW